MARIQIPLDVLTSRLNISDRFDGFRNTSLSSRFSNLRPVGEFLDFKRLSKPANFSEMQSRVNYNLGQFSSNYVLVFFVLSIYALVTSPLLLFDIVLLVAGLWLLGRLNGQDLVIGTFRATSSQLYTGLFVTVAILGLIAPTFSTVLWLLGASGVVIIGHAALMDKPIDEAFSGEARRHGHARRVDLSRDGRQRRAYGYDKEEEDESTEEDSEENSENDTEDDDDGASREKEDILVQSALARIRRAQDKGKQDVKLSKDELAALERRRKRLEAEAKARQRKASGSERKSRKEQRIAVPLSQFEVPPSRTRAGASRSDDALPRHPSPATVNHGQARGPPMGLFPPPAGSRNRPRSATSSSHRPPYSQGSSSPFEYNYVQTPPNQRHASDSSARASPSRAPYPPDDDVADWRPSSSSSRDPRDPFRYQTAGPRAPYVSGAAAARRNGSGPPGSTYSNTSRRQAPAAARSGSDETSEEGDASSTSDDQGSGAHISRMRTPEEAAIVVEEAPPSPEPERPKSKRSASRTSPAKRKPVASGNGRRRRKN
ncbi:uncharacterized protein JN550_008315 [Neoarthrinium moseri]|uniref:uncharacterized protein n=1 Tax=Neoarthrinium moseri TaxID=1658444 RepID=UPI001FDE395B|nr:uncharacterized protein JN550_008315 [Neoarthrinium moseri]KAI1865558.1 hypothetical protein JN550_008315 [Neoarthrinium moseri]